MEQIVEKKNYCVNGKCCVPDGEKYGVCKHNEYRVNILGCSGACKYMEYDGDFFCKSTSANEEASDED